MTTLDKIFNPHDIEQPLYQWWIDHDVFACTQDPDKPYFCIMMPPPNITGILHMGHALNYTLQDIMVRFKRMQGFNVLWQPGTDHAGIATQAVVERQLSEKKCDRLTLGREKFLEHTWKWKEESGQTIVMQQRRLGLSPDWQRQRFTLDEGLSRAVRHVFVSLHTEGLIYRDTRLANWDPQLQTAISDLEVKSVETMGTYWYIRYELVNQPGTFITVATSRPETLFGDTAIAVHPDDSRYQHLIGQHVHVPLCSRTIPIIADTYSNPDKGSGAVKITPAHDFNDFEVGKRHGLELINIFDKHAHLNENVPKAYQNLERFVARARVIEDLMHHKLLEKEENTLTTLPYGDRSDVVIEPYLTQQWFMNVEKMAESALIAAEVGKVKIMPESSYSVYKHWLNHIQPWCISRQLWWGHRIPVWYTQDGHAIAAEDESQARAIADEKFGIGGTLEQDPDVLDTWFSSALWPFTTLGWPDQTQELKNFYPSSVLITGNDILFFWVARMMMLGLKFMQDVPFKTVYLHALVRDQKGQKMSKSKGNSLDPLELIDTFGADALRFSLAISTVPGRDVKFSSQSVENYRNFTTKIWNAVRFLEHYQCHYDVKFKPYTLASPINQWIVARMSDLTARLTVDLNAYAFDTAAQSLYQFIWREFCDWYLEMIKPILNTKAQDPLNDPLIQETKHTSAWVMGTICHVLHPFMPFVTEKIWQHMNPSSSCPLMKNHWPDLGQDINKECTAQIEWVIETITAVRSLKSELNIAPSQWLNLLLVNPDQDQMQWCQDHAAIFEKMARIEKICFISEQMRQEHVKCAQILIQGTLMLVPLGDILNLDSERARLQNLIQQNQRDADQVDKKLNNPEFSLKAPTDIVEKNRERLKLTKDTIAKLVQALQAIA